MGELPAHGDQREPNVLTGNSRLSTERSESISDSGVGSSKTKAKDERQKTKDNTSGKANNGGSGAQGLVVSGKAATENKKPVTNSEQRPTTNETTDVSKENADRARREEMMKQLMQEQ